MSKVTLNDVRNTLTALAQLMLKDGDTAGKDSAQEQAALVRAADAVVKAAWDKNWHTERCPALYEDRPQGCTCGADALTEALAAYHKIERGE